MKNILYFLLLYPPPPQRKKKGRYSHVDFCKIKGEKSTKYIYFSFIFFFFSRDYHHCGHKIRTHCMHPLQEYQWICLCLECSNCNSFVPGCMSHKNPKIERVSPTFDKRTSVWVSEPVWVRQGRTYYASRSNPPRKGRRCCHNQWFPPSMGNLSCKDCGCIQPVFEDRTCTGRVDAIE